MDTDPWQAILLDIAVTWDTAYKVPKDARWNGLRFFWARFGYIFTGVIAGIALRAWDWTTASLPSWFQFIHIALANHARIRKISRVRDRHCVPNPWYLWNWAVWSTWLLFCCMFFSSRWWAAADVGLGWLALGAGLAWVQYIHSDGPPERLKVNWICQHDAATAYIVFNRMVYDGPLNYCWAIWMILAPA